MATTALQGPPRPVPGRAFLGVSAALFAAAAAVTAGWCSSMADMGGMAMPGGWEMSAAWMRMPGQAWSGAALVFLGMWLVMMTAMMLPSLVPMLQRYRLAVGAPPARLGALTAVVALGYFAVWTALGAAVYPLGAGLASLEMQRPGLARAVPLLAAAVVGLAGALQLTPWKRRQLGCCRAAPGPGLSRGAGAAWRHGLRLGLRCAACCAPAMAILLVAGVMDLRAMAAATAAITAERLAPGPGRVVTVLGVVGIAAGVLLALRAAGLAA